MKLLFLILTALCASSVTFVASNPVDSECVCVAYYLCNSTVDGTIYLHGEGVLDVRSQLRTPKECPLNDHGAPEVCCYVPDIIKDAPKPETILSELKTVSLTKEQAEELFPQYIIPEDPCLKYRNFGNQGEYHVIPEECKYTEKKNYDVINPEYLIYGSQKVKEEKDHNLECKPSVYHEEEKKVEDSGYGEPYGEPQPVIVEATEAHGQQEHVQEEHVHEEHVHEEHVHHEHEHYDHKKYERKCGLPLGLGVRVLGGHADDLPWLVQISTKSHYDNSPKHSTCGGSLILDKLVLTAAHCISVASKNKEILVVQTSRKDQQSVVYKTVVHPDYNPSSLLYDFALLWLETPIHLGTEFGTGLICLPPPKLYDLKTCFATGFSDGYAQKVMIPLVQEDKCEYLLRTTRLGQLFHLHHSFICAGGEKEKDTCKGDGGSPLVCTVGKEDDAPLAQVGLVAWGIGCGTEIPGVYASTGVARMWIDYEVKAAGLDPYVYHVPSSFNLYRDLK